MKSLINLAHEILEQQDKVDMLQAEHRFTEALTFASYDEIVGMLDVVLRENYVGFPVWARNLAFRLACLLQHGNSQIRRRAAEDLYRFGPDWDDQAKILLREAQDIECQR
jgi:hypothetical protein